jgi:hypothetical protein
VKEINLASWLTHNSQLETGNFIRFRRFRRFSPQSVTENGEIGKNSPSAIAAFAANSAISLCALASSACAKPRRRGIALKFFLLRETVNWQLVT